MAELAFGAVRSLLKLLQDEKQRLDQVREDMQFIRDEMESMESFLRHLRNTAPAGGQHEEPVRTWMKQVRDLAFDCSNFIDLYVRRRGGGSGGNDARDFLAYLRSVQWSVRALFAQCQTAAQIRALKVRARDVGERRLRYGVELPKTTDDSKLTKIDDDKQFIIEPLKRVKTTDDSKLTKTSSTSAQAAGNGGEGDESGTDIIMEHAVPVLSDDVIRKVVLGFPEDPKILEKCTKELVRWLKEVAKKADQAAATVSPRDEVIVIAALDKEDGGDVAREALKDPTVATLFKSIWVRVDLLLFQVLPPDVHLWYTLRGILEILLPSKTQENRIARDTWEEDEIAYKIRQSLEGKRSLIVIDAVEGEHVWNFMHEAVRKIGCPAGSAMIVITKNSQDAHLIFDSERRGCPAGSAIIYSLVDFFSRKVKDVVDRSYERAYVVKNLRGILRQIQDRCDPQTFCMKMFVHYLFANPNRTKEELDELFRKLVLPENALQYTDTVKIRETNGRELLRFCYKDLPKTDRTCLAYLAIFSPDEKIRRSRLVGRWLVEGLITGGDMAHAVRTAERCFDTLVNRWFVCPVDIGAARKVKSCTVKHVLVQELIAEIAREDQFLSSRLSRHLAQHFSVQSDLQLRRSHTIAANMGRGVTIADFMGSLRKNSRSGISHTSSQLKLLQALDLEGCPSLEKQHLKNVCNKILLLKYLSIRKTRVDRLPKKINNLMQLEILDIRQTMLPPSATKDILLPRLKCLLAGGTSQFPSADTSTAEEPFSSAEIPRKIKFMTNLEVLFHVEASPAGADKLKEIGQQLWQLRKLGVVINDNEDHLKDLLQAISDLNECLRSLSIRIKPLSLNGSSASFDREIKQEIAASLKDPPQLLESLSISGTTSSGTLLPLLVKGPDQLAKVPNQLAKVTLHNTSLNQNGLKALAKLDNLRCVRLRHNSYTESKLTFNQNEFLNLKFLVVECSEITSISFDKEATPKLENIVWSFTVIESLSGINNLPMLQELELNGASVPDKVIEDIEKLTSCRVLKPDRPQNQVEATGSAAAAAP